MPHTKQSRGSRRVLRVSLILVFAAILVAAGWTRYSSTATVSGFASRVGESGPLVTLRHRAEAAARADWPSNGAEGDTHYSALDEISPANVESLRVAWVFRTGDVSDGASDSSGPATAFEATPLMRDGTLYIATPSAHVIALDPERGTPRWTYDAHIDRASLAHNEVTTRGVSAWVDSTRAPSMPCRARIFVATFDARLIALDGRSGTPCTDFGHAGTVDLHAGVRGADRLAYEYHVTSPPAVIDELVIVGSSIFDNLHAQAPSGEVMRCGLIGISVADRAGYAPWTVLRLLSTMIEALLWKQDFAQADFYCRRLRHDSERLGHGVGALLAEVGETMSGMLSGTTQPLLDRVIELADKIEAIPLPFEGARLRLEIARRLGEMGDRDGAIRQLNRAFDVFSRIGAAGELERARAHLRELDARPRTRVAHTGSSLLSPREKEILLLVLQHKSNKEIAKALGCAHRNVGKHLENACRKLDSHSRYEAAEKARAHEFI